jgi:fumarylacetoacetase
MRSWLDQANVPACDFPIQNLPYCSFNRGTERTRCGVAIGDRVLDLAVLESEHLLKVGGSAPVFSRPALNDFMGLGPQAWSTVRARLTELLVDGGDPRIERDDALQDRALIPIRDVHLKLPFSVAEYTDFYSCRHHAFNVGSMFRGPDQALPPNWLHIPIGYNGRASTIVVSGTDVRRPLGQRMHPDANVPSFGPSSRLDFELEVGAVVGGSNPVGQPVSVAEADEMIFGYVLLNDWSARDIQAWEYQPLGPFLAKAFATSISPWVVTRAALEPYRVSTPEREQALLPYLNEPGPLLYDIELEVDVQTQRSATATTISRTNYCHMYYSAAQQLAHHTIGGCKMNVGDLLGSGTISGSGRDQFGSLLELSWGGKNPITLDNGETRSFVEDGDTVTLRGWAQGDGHRIGFGSCSGRVIPAPQTVG